MGQTALAHPETAESPSALNTNLGWLLAQASYAVTTEMTAAFADLGVSPRAHCVLSAARSGELTQKELADAVGMDKTTMVVTLDELESAGLARRVPSKTDRRARIIAVTEAGEQFVATGEKVVAEIQRDVLDSLPARSGRPSWTRCLAWSATASRCRRHASGRRAARAG